MISFATALASLTKGAAWSMVEDDYENIDWYSQEIEKPTREAVLIEQERLQKIEDSNAYKTKRASEYPPITDYLDGVVKGDQTQIDKYIADCLAVKAKYPKVTT
jgi:hypothetical protein